ncbi:unnamed protein product [Thelazia callipaeda]|uniref:protein-tyrosine-phosphatase n=1 Tax=Thelazia callipaeda TaxID=103827 RepID=A0A0N5CW60_THECL|nr:unnamed protein product [Thelazia callipaeda]
MICKVIENLYLGDVQDVMDKYRIERLKNEMKISHILTISSEEIPIERRIDGICYLFLFALDTNVQDMFAENLLARAISYIHTNTKNDDGRVLVHCEAGVSRSVFVIAAYLMQKYQWSAKRAVEYVQKIRPIAQPNDGFIKQLEIFECSDFVADIEIISRRPVYKKWLLTLSSSTVVKNSKSSLMFDVSKDSNSLDSVKYRCRKCRQTIFYDDHIVRHEISKSGTVSGDEVAIVEYCSFIYHVLPMKWMTLEAYRGKIFCLCNEKLGHYDWGGRICDGKDGIPCGTAGTLIFIFMTKLNLK